MCSDVKVIFILLKSIELIIFIVYGFLLSQTKSAKEYWKKACIPILTFTLIEGLRFGRQIDYNVYYFRYENIGNNFFSEDYELLFKTIVYILHNIGFPYWLFITANSLFLIFAIFVLLQNFRKYLKYILPVLLFCIVNSENYIRWYMAFSFIMIAFHYLINNKKTKTYIYLVCAISTHIGTLFLFPIFFFSNWICKLNFNPYVSSFLYTLTIMVISIADMTNLVVASNFLLSIGIGSVSDKVAFYLMSTEDLINGEFGRVGYAASRSFSNNIRLLLAYIPLILYAKHYVQNDRIKNFIYNIFVVGAIVSPIFTTVEILDRFSSALTFFSCIILGITLFHEFKSGKKFHKWVKIILVLCFIANFWPNISVIYSRKSDNEMLFMWDANGREYLPYWQWLEDIIKNAN